MSTESKKAMTHQQISLTEKFLYFASASLLPNIFLYVLYNNNRASVHIVIQHVLILTFALMIISIVMLLVIRFIVRSYEGSLLVLVLFWATFWLFEAIHAILPSQINSKPLLLLGVSIMIIYLIIYLRFRMIRFCKGRAIFNAFSIVICLLFIFNAFPSFVASMRANSDVDGVSSFYLKRVFNVDPSLLNPDIYWFHMDGVISLHDVEYYFDVLQDDSRERLLNLGFLINDNTEFAAGGTVQGVAALLSPDFYDSYLHEIFVEGEHLLRDGRQELFNNAIIRDGISFAGEIAPYHELFHAFLQIGYTTTMIASFTPNIYTPINQFYRLGDSSYISDYPFVIADQTLEHHSLMSALYLVELLTRTTPLPDRFTSLVSGERYFEWQAIPAYEDKVDRLTTTTLNLLHERQLYRTLIDQLENTQPDFPTLTYITLWFAHSGRWHWQTSVDNGVANRQIDLYPVAYDYTLYIMFNMIDMILERNPDAVIVLQADHGLHVFDTQQVLLEEGFTEEEVLRLFNSVISAVRIPDRYGGLDEPLAPLNITRELVNRFVGENYQLLD